nr:hypothetical protein [Actinomyces sp.]
MSRARTAAQAVTAGALIVAMSPLLAVCAGFAGLSLVLDEAAQRRRTRRERAALAAVRGEVR